MTEIDRLYGEVKDRGFRPKVKDLEHLRRIRRLVERYDNTPLADFERDDALETVRRLRDKHAMMYGRFLKDSDYDALREAEKYCDLAGFYQRQILMLDMRKEAGK